MDNLLCVIVLYKCLLENTKTYQTLMRRMQSYHLYIYDNSPEKQYINDSRIIYVHDSKNSGLSVAYNNAAKYASENGFEWLLLLDQDTDFSNILIDDYAKAISENPNIKLFAPKVRCGDKYMSPIRVWHRMGRLSQSVLSGIILLSKYSIINSGMCINVNAMIECGGYNEKVFLDHSDHEFLEKFEKLYSDAFIIDKDIIQDYSELTANSSSTINRYVLFCRSVKSCSRENISFFWLFVIVLKRCLSICCRNKTFKPFGILFREFL